MKSARVLAVMGLAALVTACASSKPVYLPDGSRGYSISCDGAAVGMNVCFEKAGQLCGSRGYDLLNREGQVVYTGVTTGSGNASRYAAQGSSFAYFGGMNTKSILVKCR